MARLILGSTHFAQQFVVEGGLAPSTLHQMLGTQLSSAALTDTLLILCQLARINALAESTRSKGAFNAVTHGTVLSERLPALLHHADAGVRAKACNLVGNLCKHSNEYHGLLKDNGLLDLLANACADPDASVRKFACFAVGNAGFHNGDLYRHLQPCIAPLVDCLSDSDSKTRANAAGALGNLARNGPHLTAELIRCHVPHALLSLALHIFAPGDADVTHEQEAVAMCSYVNCASSASRDESTRAPQHNMTAPTDTTFSPISAPANFAGGIASRLRPSRTALFSLGNIFCHADCRAVMTKDSLQEALKPFETHSDSVLRQYAMRALLKLSGTR